MKLDEQGLRYAPYVATIVKQIYKDDIVDGLLTLPDNASMVDINALPVTLHPTKIVIPRPDYQICSVRIKRKLKASFILTNGTELDSLFFNIKASKVILPNTLKLIKNSGFTNSQIDELEIPSSVEKIDNYVFKNTTIKKLIVNKKTLSQINAKYLLIKNKKTTVLVKNDSEEIKQYIIPKIDANSIASLGYIDEAIDMFVYSLFINKINSDAVNKLKKRLKIKFLRTLKIKLLFGHYEDISINDLAMHDRKFNKMLKEIVNDIYTKGTVPQISSDGFTIIKNDKKVKTLSLKEYFDSRY